MRVLGILVLIGVVLYLAYVVLIKKGKARPTISELRQSGQNYLTTNSSKKEFLSEIPAHVKLAMH